MNCAINTDLLETLATIHTGYALRGRARLCTDGDIALLTENDVAQQFAPGQLARATIRHFPSHHLLQAGDVLFHARSAHNSTLVMAAPACATICVAPLLCIRIMDPARLLPGYLAWYLSTAPARRALGRFMRLGEKRVGMEGLLSLQVLLPEVERQQRIVQVYAMQQQIAQKEQALAEKRHEYMEAALLAFAQTAKEYPQ